MAQIVFDSNDWSTIEDTINKINEIGCMQFGKTASGEDIVFNVCRDENGNDVLHTTVSQGNGWERHTYYNPVTYVTEETFQCGDDKKSSIRKSIENRYFSKYASLY